MNSSLAYNQRRLDLNKTLGLRLAKLRNEMGKKQKDVSEVFQFGRDAVSKIEHGVRRLEAVEVPDYANALGVEPEVIYMLISSVVLEYDGGVSESHESLS